jgi:hypothetical protein
MGNNADEMSYWPAAPENLIGYLEAFGETLQKDRKLFAYLVAFREDAHDKPGVSQSMLRTERNFLIKEFRIQPSRIKTIDGGYVSTDHGIVDRPTRLSTNYHFLPRCPRAS